MEFYDGREQTKAKHEILKRYLERFARITLATFPTLDFIDAFAGPWENEDEELTDTSIGIALHVLQSVAEERGLRRGDVTCIFNEKDASAYARLQAFGKTALERFPLVRMITFHGKFEDNAHAIRAASNNSFRLLFVDPTGYTGFPPNVLELFSGRSSEVIVNYMSSFIDRFTRQPRAEQEDWLSGLIGKARAREMMRAEITSEGLREAYMEMVQKTLRYRYSAQSPIHFPDTNGINFWLIFGTHHVKGMEVMRDVEFQALSEHDKDRFRRAEKKSQQMLMFDTAEYSRGPYTVARLKHLEQAPEILLKAITELPGEEFGKVRAKLQSRLFLRDVEIAAAARELAESGKIDPSWKKRGPRIKRPNATDRMWPIGTKRAQA